MLTDVAESFVVTMGKDTSEFMAGVLAKSGGDMTTVMREAMGLYDLCLDFQARGLKIAAVDDEGRVDTLIVGIGGGRE